MFFDASPNTHVHNNLLKLGNSHWIRVFLVLQIAAAEFRLWNFSFSRGAWHPFEEPHPSTAAFFGFFSTFWSFALFLSFPFLFAIIPFDPYFSRRPAAFCTNPLSASIFQNLVFHSCLFAAFRANNLKFDAALIGVSCWVIPA